MFRGIIFIKLKINISIKKYFFFLSFLLAISIISQILCFSQPPSNFEFDQSQEILIVQVPDLTQAGVYKLIKVGFILPEDLEYLKNIGLFSGYTDGLFCKDPYTGEIIEDTESACLAIFTFPKATCFKNEETLLSYFNIYDNLSKYYSDCTIRYIIQAYLLRIEERVLRLLGADASALFWLHIGVLGIPEAIVKIAGSIVNEFAISIADILAVGSDGLIDTRFSQRVLVSETYYSLYKSCELVKIILLTYIHDSNKIPTFDDVYFFVFTEQMRDILEREGELHSYASELFKIDFIQTFIEPFASSFIYSSLNQVVENISKVFLVESMQNDIKSKREQVSIQRAIRNRLLIGTVSSWVVLMNLHGSQIDFIPFLKQYANSVYERYKTIIEEENKYMEDLGNLQETLIRYFEGPSPISDLVANSNEQGEIELSWSAPDDGSGNQLDGHYEIRWNNSEVVIKQGIGHIIPNDLSPKAPGEKEQFIVSGLSPGNIYYFIVRAVNNRGYRSGISNIASSNVGITSERIILLNPKVIPDPGNESTSSYEFLITAKYLQSFTDGVYKIYINGAYSNMTKISGLISEGAMFKYSYAGSFPNGSTQKYHFEFSGNFQGQLFTKRLPSVGEFTLRIGSVLYGGHVIPNTSDYPRLFIYKVNWRHPEGTMPTKALLYKRNGPSASHFMALQMKLISGNALDGAVYGKEAYAWAGDTWDNEFCFEFECGGQTYRDPPTGYYQGPIIARYDDFEIREVTVEPEKPLGGQKATIRVAFANMGTVARNGAEVKVFVDGNQIGNPYYVSSYIFAYSWDECAFDWQIDLLEEVHTYNIEARIYYPGDSDPSNDSKSIIVTVEPPPGSISGYVFDEFSNEVLGATVKVIDGPSLASFETDENGYYILDGLKPGTYSLLAYKDEMKQTQHNIIVKAGEETPNVNFILSILETTELYKPDSSQSDAVYHNDWSYDGTKLIFDKIIKDWEVFVVNENGSGLIKVAGEGLTIYYGRYPSASKISDRFCFLGRDKDNQGNTRNSIFVFRFSNLTNYEIRIDNNSGSSNSIWYPDRDEFLYDGVDGNIWRYNCDTVHNDIFMYGKTLTDRAEISPDGQTILIHNDLYNTNTKELIKEYFLPLGVGASWIPDGSGIVYESDFSIWIGLFDYTEPYKYIPYKFIGSENLNFYPSISNDGDYLAFTSTRGFAISSDHIGLWKTPFTTSNLFLSGFMIEPPKWFTPNGDGVDDFVTISFNLDRTADVSISILDSSGNLIRKVWDKEHKDKGTCSVVWSGITDIGTLSASQAYYVMINAIDESSVSAHPVWSRVSLMKGSDSWYRNGLVSPDLNKIAYVSGSYGAKQLWIKSLDTADEPIKLFEEIAIYNEYARDLSWDRISTKIVFGYGTENDPKKRIAVVDTTNPSTVLTIVTNQGRDLLEGYWTNWSPNGEEIAFVGHWQAYDSQIGWVDRYDFFIVNSEGTSWRRITNFENKCEIYSKPVWTTDGQYIIFTAYNWSTKSVDVYKISVPLSGQPPIVWEQAERMTFHPTHESPPSITPEGEQFVYCSNRVSGAEAGDTWVEYLDHLQRICQVLSFMPFQVSDDGFYLYNDALYVELFESISKGTVIGQAVEEIEPDTIGVSTAIVETWQVGELKGQTVSGINGAFKLMNLPPGDYEIIAKKEGYLESPSQSITIHANKITSTSPFLLTKLPQVEIVSPLIDSRCRDTVVIEAFEMTNDVTRVDFEYREEANVNWTLIISDNESPFNYSWDVTNLIPEGSETKFEIRAMAYNGADLKDDVPSTTFIDIDKKAPSAHIISHSNGDSIPINSQVILEANSTDEDLSSLVFKYRLVGDDVWINIGNIVPISPYTIIWDTSTLLLGASYEVIVVATDLAGNVDASPEPVVIVSILEPPETPSSPEPQDSSENVPISTNLNWADCARALSYDLYLWKASEEKPSTPTVIDLPTSEYDPPSDLEYDTPYKWQVIAKNNTGQTAGDEWIFTTESGKPDKPSSPNPSHLSYDMPIDTDFDWADCARATSYDIKIWLWGDPEPIVPTAQDLTESRYDPPNYLQYYKQYEWRVIAKNSCGSTEGDEWVFRTCNSPYAKIDSPQIEIVEIQSGGSLDFQGTGTGYNIQHNWNFDGVAPDSNQEDPGEITFTQRGLYTVIYKVTDEWENWATDSVQVIVKDSAPELISISLFDKDKLTEDVTSETDCQEIKVEIETSGTIPTHIMLSENANFNGAYWREITDPIIFRLTSKNGEKTVYAKVGGLCINESNSVSDSINLNTNDDAQIVSDTIPSEMSPGQMYMVSVTLQNTGSSIWPFGWDLYRLGAVGDSDDLGGNGRHPMPKDVYPNDEVTIYFYLTAPTTHDEYTTDWQMVKEGEHWFGEKLVKIVNVRDDLILNNSEYVIDYFPEEVPLKQERLFIITFKNTGNATWTQGDLYRLGVVGDNPPKGFPGRVELPYDVIPGEEVTFNFWICPEVEGEFNITYQMLQEYIEWFGDEVPKTIKVVKYTQVDEKIFELYE